MGDHRAQSPPDFYKILSIPRDASLQDIRKAYKSLIRRWHPDKHPASHQKEAEEKCKAINEAYKALTSDKEMRSMDGINYLKKNDWEYDFFGFTYDSNAPRKAEKPGSADDLFGKSDYPTRSKSSRRSNIPTHSSYSGVRRKPPPIEKKLECTLEELCHGCVKKIMVTRDVLTSNGMVSREEELMKIKVKPGWKKGTRITFEGMGDHQKPNALAADLTFMISEKQHPLFKRDGDDLVFARQIPLLKALTGFTLSITLLGGEKMSCTFKEIIYPGYEKIIKGQGMPDKEHGRRGDLRIKFYVVFPIYFNEEQRSGIRSLLLQVD